MTHPHRATQGIHAASRQDFGNTFIYFSSQRRVGYMCFFTGYGSQAWNSKRAGESNPLHKLWLVTGTLTGTQLSMQFRLLKLFPATQCEIVSGLVPLRGLTVDSVRRPCFT